MTDHDKFPQNPFFVAATALAGAVAMGGGGVHFWNTGLEQRSAQTQASYEQCFGVARAGENGCADAAGTHACAAQSLYDYHGGDWKLVPDGTCLSIGGRLAAFEGLNPHPPQEESS